MENNNYLKTTNYLKTIGLLIALTSAQLFQACISNDTNRGKEEIAKLAPEDNDGGTMIDSGSGSITIEHKNPEEIKEGTISIDTTNIIAETDPLSADTTINQPYTPFENIINNPTTPGQVEQNIEYMEVQIKRSTDPESLMLIAASEYCNTYLIINIIKSLKTSDNLTEQRKKILSQLFKQRLDQECKNNPFNDEINETLKEGKLNTLDKTLNLGYTTTQNPDN